MGNILYLECNSGISGDMTVAALLDLGADEKKLLQVLDSIPADGYEIRLSRVKKSGVDCMDFDVVLDHAHENHDHDMEYLHGGAASAEVGTHAHHSHTHHHAHRGMAEITDIIDRTDMTEPARKIAKRIFQVIAEAEAKAHAVPVSEVHFHEVGAIDSIVDVISVAFCLDDLGISEVIVPKVCEGTGTVRCQHGVLPVPVPAVANIIAAYGLPVEFMDIQGEFVTPTGAAIIAATMTGQTLPIPCKIQGIGMGAGKRTYERPSILRAMLIERTDTEKTVPSHQLLPDDHEGVVCKLESNVDDCTGEALGFVMEELLAAGARDVFYTPAYMKKNRPGYQISVICMPEDADRLAEIIFKHTTTIGIRKQTVQRYILDREVKKVDTPYGEAAVKICRNGSEAYVYPEYESVAGICREQGKSFQEVYTEILHACRHDDI